MPTHNKLNILLETNLTLKQIARKLDVRYVLLAKEVKAMGVDTVSRGRRLRLNKLKEKYKYITKEKLQSDISNSVSVQDMAYKYNCSVSLIQTKIKEFCIDTVEYNKNNRKKQGTSKKVQPTKSNVYTKPLNSINITRPEMKHYIAKGVKPNIIADLNCCKVQSVKSLIKEYGLNENVMSQT